MSTNPPSENWTSRMGVVLAVAGSAVGLGNFLRFPGQAVDNGGGAFMIPYIVSFLLLGVPIAWCEWTLGRLGGRYGQNSGPGVMYALWRRAPGKVLGAMTLMIPVAVYCYYVVLEAWCLDYAIEFARGGFRETFGAATAGLGDGADEVPSIVGASGAHFSDVAGTAAHGAVFEGGRMLGLVLLCFLVNFVVIYNGISRGIELFCKWAMPLLLACAVIVLVRVLTLPDITKGLGFMWNPRWESLSDPQVWLAASGQIFFSMSVGFGLILCYSSYLRRDDDVVLTSLSAASTNEFAEVVLGGMIIVPTAFLFLGAEAASEGTFGLGFVTVPAIMHFMPGGSFFGALWFGLLFLAAVTSSLSMLQPAIAFLEDGFGLRRRSSVALLGLLTFLGAAPVLYFSRGAAAMDNTDFWCNLMMIVVATGQVIVFGWIIGAERGVEEMNRGADVRTPRFLPFMLRWVTPTFLFVVLGAWAWGNLPDRIRSMSPDRAAVAAEREVYRAAIEESDGVADAAAILGEDGDPIPASLPDWLEPRREEAEAAGAAARASARVAGAVFLVMAGVLVALIVLADIASRGRIGDRIAEAEADGPLALGDRDAVDGGAS